ncbi:MAG: hypothetical protein M3478_02875, partial [Planctomycetota bacterium]|nr:hypothetical protein [Planctomycetota bacterium]
MTRSMMAAAAAAFVTCGSFIAPALAQQPAQGQAAVGSAAVRTRQNAQTIQLDQHQTPVIAVLYGQQQGDTQIMAMVTSPDQPQQDKEILFNRENANKRTVVHEGEQAAGQARRIVLVARRGQEDVQIEKLAENQGIMVYGVRKPEPKVAQQPQQPAQPAAPAEGAAAAAPAP